MKIGEYAYFIHFYDFLKLFASLIRIINIEETETGSRMGRGRFHERISIYADDEVLRGGSGVYEKRGRSWGKTGGYK